MGIVPYTILMRVIEISEYGAPHVLRAATAPVPVPAPGQVLITLHAAGINRADILQRQGHYAPPPGANPVLGLEGAGVVEALGQGVDTFRLGQRVAALLDGGGYADVAVAPVGQVLPLPDTINFIQGAALMEAMTTVYQNLCVTGGVEKGQTVLITGGASGLGTMAIQMLHQIGVTVITTAGTDDKCRLCEKLGAVRAINYRTHSVLEEAQKAAPQGVHVVLDMLGGAAVNPHLQLLRQGGIHISIAYQLGRTAPIDMARVMMKQLTLTGNTLRPRTAAEKATLVQGMAQLFWPMVAQSAIKPVIDRVFLLEQAADAHTRMESVQHAGKIILAVNP